MAVTSISINEARTVITIASDLLDYFIVDPTLYNDIKITGSFNGGTGVMETYSQTIPINSTTNVATLAGVETINPAFFSSTEFAQGIYQFDIALSTDGAIAQESACLFVENGLACSINDYRNLDGKLLSDKLMVVSDYFLLKNSQDCACECTKLAAIYNSLITTLSNSNCKTC